jgi:hypothetical protein
MLIKKGLDQVTGTLESNAKILTQARNSLPTLLVSLEKLSSHYMVNMPQISRSLESTRNQISKLESGPVNAPEMFRFTIDVDHPPADQGGGGFTTSRPLWISQFLNSGLI